MYNVRSCKANHAARYYTEPQAGSVKSEWIGQGAKCLGLTGAVERPDFTLLLKGRTPGGELIVQRQTASRIAAFDVTLSAPKSVSLAVLYEGDEEILKAHRQAVTETFSAIEQQLQVRVYRGRESEFFRAEDVVTANFHHTLSRELDPQLHNHLVIINAARYQGAWRGLYPRKALYEQAMDTGQLYRESLGTKLQALGHELRGSGDKLWEMARYPREVLSHFSKRRQAIEESVGVNASAKAKQAVAMRLRPDKNEIPLPELHARWREEMRHMSLAATPMERSR